MGRPIDENDTALRVPRSRSLDQPSGRGGSTWAGLGPSELTGPASRGPRNVSRSDDRIREDLCEALTNDPHVDPSDVEVTVERGLVKLSGTVTDRETKRAIVRIAEATRGVHDVEVNLRLSRGELR